MAKITSRGRKRMKASSFAIPSKRKYPISDITHARMALAMVAAHGTKSEQSQVRKAVHKKYPSIQITGMSKKRKGQ